MTTLLDEDEPTWFPDPINFDDDGLVAVSEKLGTERQNKLVHLIFQQVFYNLL